MKKRVHVLFECGADRLPYGASHIRLLRPLSHPSIQDRFSLSYGTDLPGIAVDLVIVERGWRHDSTLADQEHLLGRLATLGVPYIYGIDDNLLDLNSLPGSPGYPSAEQRQIIVRFARNAAGIIVSTRALGNRMARLNSNIEIVPNNLDERLFDFDSLKKKEDYRRNRGDSKLVMGYMGTYSHLEDLLMVVEPLRKLLYTKRESIRLEVVGIGDEALVKGLFNDLPVSIVKVPNDRVEYPKFMEWMQKEISWDFAIAPLVQSDFNDCKSDLKFLDYSINGIPGIFSATESYVGTISDGKNGFLASASSQQWFESLMRIAENSSIREAMAKEAFSYVHKSRTLEKNAPLWGDAIDRIFQKRGL
ncbi:hypothetical protein EJP67_10105 [Variovorax guangxiensis]|uniref:Glycosyltransferase n=1 Tax=Variovorax guangxiensis TaxID=1775474 RepID=A0A3S0Z2P7_9BURK|nr:glycosyltransferase [Variovorax guangxiensis]RUR67414.1 hypothetical protein EJP67_10105 [Variovorax guangxiensis]